VPGSPLPGHERLRRHLGTVSRAWETLPQLEARIRPGAEVVLHLFSAIQGRFSGDAAELINHTGRALDLLRGAAVALPAAEEYAAIALNLRGMGLLWAGAQWVGRGP